MTRIQVVYRNYIPLYSGYDSFVSDPPSGVEFVIPPPRRYLRHAYRFYRGYGHLPGLREAIRFGQKRLFREGRISGTAPYSALYYVGILPENDPGVPFVIDVEHVNVLLSFISVSNVSRVKQRACEVIESENCLAVLAWSQAALRTAEAAFGVEFERIRSKFRTVYPALGYLRDRHAPSRGGRVTAVGLPLAVSAVSGCVPV